MHRSKSLALCSHASLNSFVADSKFLFASSSMPCAHSFTMGLFASMTSAYPQANGSWRTEPRHWKMLTSLDSVSMHAFDDLVRAHCQGASMHSPWMGEF